VLYRHLGEVSAFYGERKPIPMPSEDANDYPPPDAYEHSEESGPRSGPVPASDCGGALERKR
jgi:hypothetical protein